MGGSSARISGKSGADRGELSTDGREFGADTGKFGADTGKFGADTGKFSADTGKLLGCLKKQPVQKVGWAVFVFVSLVGLLYDEFFVFLFQR